MAKFALQTSIAVSVEMKSNICRQPVLMGIFLIFAALRGLGIQAVSSLRACRKFVDIRASFDFLYFIVFVFICQDKEKDIQLDVFSHECAHEGIKRASDGGLGLF